MTENKRFTLKKYTSEDYAILDDGTEIAYASNKSAFTFCELLNELAEENKKQKDFINQLQEELVFFKTANVNVILKLEEENEKLKQEVEEYKEAMKRMMIDMMR